MICFTNKSKLIGVQKLYASNCFEWLGGRLPSFSFLPLFLLPRAFLFYT